jgi:hypothetical protein
MLTGDPIAFCGALNDHIHAINRIAVCAVIEQIHSSAFAMRTERTSEQTNEQTVVVLAVGIVQHNSHVGCVNAPAGSEHCAICWRLNENVLQCQIPCAQCDTTEKALADEQCSTVDDNSLTISFEQLLLTCRADVLRARVRNNHRG